MAAVAPLEISLPETKSCKISKLKVKSGSKVSRGSILLLYKCFNGDESDGETELERKLKSQHVGVVQDILANEGDEIKPGSVVVRIARCSHPTVMKDMCAECGEDLRKDDDADKNQSSGTKASVAMIHSIPELHVSKEEAAVLAKLDEDSLIKHKKLVLLVDLDQTLIHTTLEEVPADMPDVHHFQLRKGPMFPWYHTKIRDNCQQFLDQVSQYYQLHIFTMGVRLYAHTVAELIDPEGKFFSHRILSRDECFDPNSKKANLRSIFPRGDKMVCIIDDRDDVWNFAPNLIQVPPFRFFEGTGDINTPPNFNDRSSNVPPSKKPSRYTPTLASRKGDGDGKESKEAAEEGERSSNTEEAKEADERSELCSSVVSSTTKDSEEESSENKDEVRVKGSGECEKKETTKDEMEEGEITPDKGSDSDKVTTTDGTGKEAKSPEEDKDEYLIYLADTLERIHRKFFRQAERNPQVLPDLKAIVPGMRMSVLKGCTIVFSSVFPTNMPPEQSRVWKVALALGAKVSPQIVTKSKEEQAKGRATTHLVAAKVGTSKVHSARRSKNIFIVEPDWLWCCWERWERVDERLFLLADVNKHDSRSSTPGYSDTESTGSQKARKGKAKVKANTNGNGPTGMPAQRTKSRPLSLSEDYNPMFSFSSEDLASMDKEVEDMFGSESSESSSESSDDDRSNPTSLGSVTIAASSSSSDESLTAENPRGWKRKRDEMEDIDDDDDANEFDPFLLRPQEDSSSSAGLSEGEEWFSEEEGQKMANAIDDLLTYKRSVRKWDEG